MVIRNFINANTLTPWLCVCVRVRAHLCEHLCVSYSTFLICRVTAVSSSQPQAPLFHLLIFILTLFCFFSPSLIPSFVPVTFPDLFFLFFFITIPLKLLFSSLLHWSVPSLYLLNIVPVLSTRVFSFSHTILVFTLLVFFIASGFLILAFNIF